jgi:GAF domain
MTRRTWIFGKEFMRSMPDAQGDRSKGRLFCDTKIEAAKTRLRECMDAAETLEAIREIVSNLLGCETMYLLRFDRTTRAFCSFWSFGIDAAKISMIDNLNEPASSCAALGSTYITEDLKDRSAGGRQPKVTVFIPIRSGGEVTAVLALLKFLPQKLGIDKIDNEIFQILSEEVGSMLFSQDAGATAPSRPERQS